MRRRLDRVNIYQATINGMYEAVFSLRPEPDKVLIDAVPLDNLPMPSQSIIKGDARSASIAAASILAKVTRDRLMDAYDKEYPEYGFARHKGYGTAEHIAALKNMVRVRYTVFLLNRYVPWCGEMSEHWKGFDCTAQTGLGKGVA